MASLNPLSGAGFTPLLSPNNNMGLTQNATSTGGPGLVNNLPQFDSFTNSNNPFSGGLQSGSPNGMGDIMSLLQSLLQMLMSMMGGQSGNNANGAGDTGNTGNTGNAGNAGGSGETSAPPANTPSAPPADPPAGSQPPPSDAAPQDNPPGAPPGQDKPTDGPGSQPKADSQSPTPAGDGKTVPIQGGGPNETVLKNNGKDPMKVAFMKNPTPENPKSEPQIVEIPAGQTMKAGLPDGWKGRIYKVNDDGSQEATLGEVNFEKGKTWYDVSAIDGFNGGMTIAPTAGAGRGTGNDKMAGSDKDIREGAPSELQQNGGKELVGTKPVGDYGSNKQMVDYLRKSYGGTGDVYTNPIDDREKDSPMRDTTDTSLTINLY